MHHLKPFHIRTLILEGEGSMLDFKKTITSCAKIAKTLVAFANNKGGKLLIGINDNGEIRGVRSEYEEKYMLNKAAHIYCKPALELTFEEVYIDDKIILVVTIPEGDLKPHYALGDDNKWWVYVRVKDQSQLASKIMVNVLKMQSREEGVLIEYSEKEKEILEYLESHDRISFPDFGKIFGLSRRKAERIMVNLILSGLIRVVRAENQEYYAAV